MAKWAAVMRIPTSATGSKGFTLIELLIVLLIIGVIASIAMLSINTTRPSATQILYSQLPPVPWPIFSGLMCQPAKSLPLNNSIQSLNNGLKIVKSHLFNTKTFGCSRVWSKLLFHPAAILLQPSLALLWAANPISWIANETQKLYPDWNFSRPQYCQYWANCADKSTVSTSPKPKPPWAKNHC